MNRVAFTLIEMLVSISIIAVLMSLVLPAIQSARSAARQTQCLNNLRNHGVAMNGYLAAHDRFPAAGNWAGIPGRRYPGHNWVVELLPYLDRTDLADRWEKELAFNAGDNSDVGQTHLKILVCPEDYTTNGGGDLSYGVAGGIGYTTFLNNVHDCPVDPFGNAIDLNGNGVICATDDSDDGPFSDRFLLKRLGLFFMENWGPNPGVVRHHTSSTVRDGFSNTLMVIENVRTGYDPYRPSHTWAAPYPRSASVFYNSGVCPANICRTGNVDYRQANAGEWKINAGRAKPEGASPFASSFHPGGVNVVFADGHATFLNEDVDGRVYAALFSPDSVVLDRTSMKQPVVSDLP